MNLREFSNATMWLAVELFYLVTFGLAAWLKWSGGMPQWFAEQFETTWLVRSPFGLRGAFYLLALLESVAFVGFMVSLIRLEWARGSFTALRASLVFSMFVFVVLAYGSRLTGKFDIAGWNYLYFLGSLVTLPLLDRPGRGERSPTPHR